MERYGRNTEGSQADPSPEWTAPGPETGLEGESFCLLRSAFEFGLNFGCDLVGFWGECGLVLEFGLILVFRKMQNLCGRWASDPGNRTRNGPTRPIAVTTSGLGFVGTALGVGTIIPVIVVR